ncbi:Efflux RND transporter periplasmic adaptor subun it [Candidatus Magnetomoraceae bacterium gMMP-15]
MKNKEKKYYESAVDLNKFRVFIKVLLPLLVLGIGIAGATYINKTAVKPRKRQAQQITPLVQTQVVQKKDQEIIIKAMGTVMAAREIQIKPKVSGEIISEHTEFTQGGYLKAGEEILKIDPKDYELAVIPKTSQVVNYTYALKLELGSQDVAKQEWMLLNGNKSAKTLDKELALRKPHLQKAKADLAASKAELEQAKLNLSRTRIIAPFNAVVREKNVEIGSQVSTQENLAELVGTDEYRVKVSIPVDRLKWIKIPSKSDKEGAEVLVCYSSGEYVRKGRIICLLSDLETQGRMARILVSVKDPLNLKESKTQKPPLLIGEYVRVEIKGRKLENVISIHRKALRDGDKIWLAGNDGKLKIKKVKPLWKDQDTVILQNEVSESERLIISNLTTPVEGMKICFENPKIIDPKAIALKKGKRSKK